MAITKPGDQDPKHVIPEEVARRVGRIFGDVPTSHIANYLLTGDRGWLEGWMQVEVDAIEGISKVLWDLAYHEKEADRGVMDSESVGRTAGVINRKANLLGRLTEVRDQPGLTRSAAADDGEGTADLRAQRERMFIEMARYMREDRDRG